MKLKDLAIASLILLSGGTIFLYLYFAAALSQERDTPDVLKAALEMELSRADVNPIHANPNRLLVRASGLETYLGQQGWSQVDRFGALRIYGKGSQRLHVYCDAFSGRYLICKLYPNPSAQKL